MSKVTQKEAVFSAIINVVGEQDGAYNLTKEQRAQVSAILFEGFRSGTIEIDGEKNDSQLKAYTSGLMSNWLRKDKRLNGGEKYSAKNPGSRAGAGDQQLKAMRGLLTTLTDEADRAEVQAHIDTRVAELSAAKAKKSVTIDASVLPESLKAFVK